ncbi:MAG TPA: endonuclease III [Chloroflexota bacterium]|nr:endonuclease III [Chloroflexota bacterium]
MVARRAPATSAPPPPAAAESLAERQARARAINEALTAYYGEPVPTPVEERRDPLSELILVVLSQHTSDANSDRAFASLRARFPDWEAVRTAPVEEVAAAIRSGGLATLKAVRIQRILNQIRERTGRLDLEFLRQLPLSEARAFLRALDGVGPKSAACVLLFSLGLPAMPVDTHVHRVARRLGLIAPRLSAEAAHDELERLVPAEEIYRFHVNLIRHGRQICKAQRPRCPSCPIQHLCPYPRTVAATSAPAAAAAAP